MNGVDLTSEQLISALRLPAEASVGQRIPKKMLAEMQSGQVVRVLATDPGAVKDFQAFARQTGNELVGQGETADKAFEFFLKRK